VQKRFHAINRPSSNDAPYLRDFSYFYEVTAAMKPRILIVNGESTELLSGSNALELADSLAADTQRALTAVDSQKSRIT
jgi:hypothetical protein